MKMALFTSKLSIQLMLPVSCMLFMSSAFGGELVARTDFEVPDDWKIKPVMGKTFWPTLPAALSNPHAMNYNIPCRNYYTHELLSTPVFRDSAIAHYAYKSQKIAPKDTTVR